MATVNADLREIRQCVYGRDMREPIVDALLHIRPDEKYKEAGAENTRDLLLRMIDSLNGWQTATAVPIITNGANHRIQIV